MHVHHILNVAILVFAKRQPLQEARCVSRKIDTDTLNELKKNISDSNSIYDILAAAYKAFSSGDTGYVSKKDGYDRNNYRDLIDQINNFHEEMAEAKSDEREINAFNVIKDYIYSFSWLFLKGAKTSEGAVEKETTYLDLYALIHNLDILHPYITPQRGILIDRSNPLIEFSSLNAHLDQILIIPRINAHVYKQMGGASEKTIKRLYDRSDAGSSDSINYILENYDILNINKGDYLPHVHRFNRIYAYDIDNRLRAKENCIRVGLFPLWGGNIRDVLYIKESDESFWIDEDATTDDMKVVRSELKERYIKALDRCKDMNVDIVVFPEMLMTRTILNEVESYIENCAPYDLPLLMIMGSIWEKDRENSQSDSNAGQNVSVVFSSYGQKIFEQHKKIPFDYRNKKETSQNSDASESRRGHQELLSQRDKKIHIIDIGGFGRIFTLICRDVLNSTLITLLKDLRADMVLVPMFSPSINMLDELESLTKVHLATEFLCNSCSALCEDDAQWFVVNVDNDGWTDEYKDKLGGVFTPEKENGKQTTVCYSPICFSESCEKCQSEECLGSVFDIKYNEYSTPKGNGALYNDRTDVAQKENI